MNRAIHRGKLNDTIDAILHQENEDRQWDLYCAIIANPFAEDIGSFEDFRHRFNPSPETEQSQTAMSKAQVKSRVDKANEILSKFTPSQEGGERL